MNKRIFIILTLLFCLLLESTGQDKVRKPDLSKGYKPIVIDPAYEHDKWETLPKDIVYKFGAFVTSFDSDDDDNGDKSNDKWGIPEWVAYEIKEEKKEHKSGPRPSKWMTDNTLNKEGIAPTDATYAVPGTTKLRVVSTDSRYVRGHMCPKQTAERISLDAGYNTHTVLNAVPQLQWQNNGVWKDLENRCNSWADKYKRIWVVCGPVFFAKDPSVWLGQDDEVKAAVPDALFKIVVREAANEEGMETLAFIIPNVLPKSKKLEEFIVDIKDIEELTGLNFLSKVDAAKQEKIETRLKILEKSGKPAPKEINW